MTRKFQLRLLAALFAAIFLLAACSRAQTPEPTRTPLPLPSATVTAAEPDIIGVPQATEAVATSAGSGTLLPISPPASPPTAAPSVYPPPRQAEPTSTTSSGAAYPGPGAALPTSTTSSGTPYPLAGTSAPVSPSPAPQQRQPSPYPGIATATPSSVAATPSPGSGGATPTAIVPLPPTPTPGPGGSPTPGGAGVLSPSATPFEVKARILATSPETFEIISGQPQLVEFFAYWSPGSRSMAPVMNALEDRYEARVRFVYLDIDDPRNSLFKSLIGSRLPPLFYLLDSQGTVLKEWQGIVPPEDFESAFAENGY